MKRPPWRSLWRTAREIPVLGRVFQVADRVWWFRKISRSSLVDPEYYAAQLGRRTMRRDTAILHYVFVGFRRGLSLNPLFDEIFAGGALPEVLRVPAFYAYLLSDRFTVAVHPWWDHASCAVQDQSTQEPPLEWLWGRREQAHLELTAAGRAVTVSVAQMRSWAIQDAVEWARHDLQGAAAHGERGSRASVIRFVQQRDRGYARLLSQLARVARGDVESIAVLVEPDAAQWVSARLLSRIDPTIRVTGCRRTRTWARAVSAAAADCRGDVLVVLDPRCEFEDSELARMIERARDGVAVIPAGRASDGTLVGVGAAHVGSRFPWRILQHHPQEDLSGLGDEPIDVPLLTGRTIALPRRAFQDARGWDDALVNDGELEILSYALKRWNPSIRFVADLTIRPVQEEPERAFRRRHSARFAAALRRRAPSRDDDRARELIEMAGFELQGWRVDRQGRPAPRLRWRPPTSSAQRWAIKICAPAGRRGAVWGDTHFAEGLAAALKRRGHEVVIDAFEASNRPTTYLDDVSVVVRGPYRIDPPATRVSLQWIISHPDQITKAEVSRFDRVFAASVSWSRIKSAKWGIGIEPLLECTDTDKFYPRGLSRGDDIVFVGTARGIARPSVVAPLAAGIPVRVYGPDWRPFIPASAIAATSIPNMEVPARYETASVVLNDQWPAMRRLGFIAMRPFDAVAVGGRVISERVDDIEEIFRGAVVTYRDDADLIDLLRRDPAELFPDAEALAEIAAYVRAEHSFDARAEVLDTAQRAVAGSAPHSGMPQDPG